MPTPKQTRDAVKKIRHYTHKLQHALNHAHEINVLVYDDYISQSPCKSLNEVRERVRLTTKEACYQAFINEIKQEEW